jgi:outer membrane lipoprotein LolB
MPRYRSLPLALAAAAVLALAGCATSTANLSSAPVAAYRDTIDLNGKINVTYQNNNETNRIIAKFSWAQRPGQVDVSLFDSFGQTVGEISVTPEAATLTQPKRAPRTEKDIDTLTRQALGYSLPVAGLRDWLQGYATDAQGKRFAASPANNSVFTRDGWNLRFAEWQDKPGPNGAPLPKLIQANRSATADSGDLSIVITILPEG